MYYAKGKSNGIKTSKSLTHDKDDKMSFSFMISREVRETKTLRRRADKKTTTALST